MTKLLAGSVLLALASLLVPLSTSTEPFSFEPPKAYATASGALSASPLNHNFQSGRAFVAAPTNHEFDNGSTGWSIDGDSSKVTFHSSGGHSNGYVKTDGGFSNWAVSSAFTLSSTGDLMSVWIKRDSGNAQVYAASGPNYTNWTQVLTVGSGASDWTRFTVDLSSFAGQSVKVKFRGFLGTVSWDEPMWVKEVPGWTMTAGNNINWQPGTASATTASLGNDTYCSGSAIAAYSGPSVRMFGNHSITSDPFTVSGDSQGVAFHFSAVSGSPWVGVDYYRESESYATAHALFGKSFSTGQAIYTRCSLSGLVNAGEGVKLKVKTISGSTIDLLDGGQGMSFNHSVIESPEQEPVSYVSGLPSQRYTDLAIPGKGVALDFTRTWAPGGAIVEGSLGWGWTHSYNAALTVESGNSVLVDYPGGARALFTYSGGTYTAPQGVYDTLVKNGDNTYTLTTSQAAPPQLQYGREADEPQGSERQYDDDCLRR